MKRIWSFMIILLMICSLGLGDTKKVYADEMSVSNFDLDIYKANLAFENGNNPVNNGVPPYVSTVENLHNANHPSGALINDLNKDDSFSAHIKAWNALTFQPTDQLDTILEESEYDFAILVAMLNISTTSDKTISAMNSKYESTAKTSVGYINKYLKSVYGVTSTGSSELSGMNKEQVKDAVTSMMEKKYNMVNNIDAGIKIFDQYYSSMKDIEEIVQKITTYVCIYQMEEETFSVLEHMYNLTADNNLRYALDKIVSCKGDILATVENAVNDSGTVVFESLFKSVVGDMWSAVIKDSPAAPIYYAQQTSKQICNICFSTDEISEQYYKMNELCEIENLLVNATQVIGNEYINDKSSQNAKVYNNAVELYINLCDVSADYALEFANIIYNNSAASIFLDRTNYDNFVNTANSIKIGYKTTQDGLNTSYLEYLLEDYPEIYKEYNDLLNGEDENIKDSGSCGENVYWTLYNDGKLQISGTGKMSDYSAAFRAPWISAREVYIEDGVTSIGVNAFNLCALESITIPKSVTSIGMDAFRYCRNLESITIPNGVTSIGIHAFEHCNNLKSVIIPESVTNIKTEAFLECSSLESITIPKSVANIERFTFYKCSSLESITISNGVISIGENAFELCNNLKSITIPNSVTSIGMNAFGYCRNLESIVIPNSVTSIGPFAFDGCSNLESIMIPNSVTSIGENAFKDCPKLTLSVYPNSYALDYAKENSIKYNLLESPKVNATAVKLNCSSKTILKGASYKLSAKITPSNTTNQSLKWSTSNSKIATVDQKGNVKAVGYGKASITVKTVNGKTATCTVTVPYTIKYNLNGGTNNKANPSSYYGKKVTLKNPQKKGYSFVGWYSDSKYKTKVTSISSGNKTLYAKWSKIKVDKAKTPTLTNVATRKLKISYTATKGANGYQIQYATNSKFSGATGKTTTAKSYTISSLTKGKVYYVRVRAYIVDSTGNKVYGFWSNSKNIKISK